MCTRLKSLHFQSLADHRARVGQGLDEDPRSGRHSARRAAPRGLGWAGGPPACFCPFPRGFCRALQQQQLLHW